MNNAIAEIGNNDLHNAVKTLYHASLVLKNLPAIHGDADMKNGLYVSAKLAIRAVQIVLGNIYERLETLDASNE